MGGLLYKDFVAVKAKKVMLVLFVLTLLFLALRFMLPGSELSGSNDFTGDMFLWQMPCLLAVAGIGFPNGILIKAIVAGDENNKIKAFTKSLPLGKNTYIASKYIFMGITCYAFMSLEMIWCIIYSCNAGDNSFYDLIQLLMSFIIIFASVSLVVSGIELPFFITLGVKKASTVKAVIMEIVFLLVIAFMFFGDLDKLGGIDLFNFVMNAKEHEFEIDLEMVLSPVIAVLLYYLSYKLTCALNRNREADFND